MPDAIVAVVDTTPDIEWWQRWQAHWLRWIAAAPRRSRLLRSSLAASTVFVLVASLLVGGFGRGARVWWWCTLILVWWLVLTPTRTVRWSSVLRMFSLSIPWAVVIAVASTRLADVGGLDVGLAGPSIGIAAVFEETMKLAPLALLGVLAPGRIRRFGATDWLVMGLAAGMGFQVAEDFVRQATFEPGPLTAVLGEQSREYGVTLFGGSFDYLGIATYAGHHVETAIVAGTFGVVVQLGRMRPGWWWRWSLPVVALAMAIVDHAGFNAAVADPVAYPQGRSTVPSVVHRLWDWTGHGTGRTWLLVAVAAGALLLDGWALRERRLPPPRPLPTPGTLSPPTPAQQPSLFPRAVVQAGTSIVALVRGSLQEMAARYAAAAPASIPRRLVGAWAGAEQQRARRELVMSRALAPVGRSAIRGWSMAVVVAVVLGGSALAHVLSERIGPTIIPVRGGWFADLLDLLGDWWDDLGPGGQAVVVLGGLSLLALGLLFPTTLVLAGGAVVTGTTTVPTLVAAGAGVTSIALMAQAASGGTGGTGGGDFGGSQSPRRQQLLKRPGQIASRLGVSEQQVNDALHEAKEELFRSGSRRNPDVFVDIATGEIYPPAPGGRVGDSIGNIFDYLPRGG